MKNIQLTVAGLVAAGVIGAAPIAAEAQQQSKFIYSAVGPGAGYGTIGMGGRVFIIIPTFDLNYVRGISDNFDFILQLSTLGVINFADIGVKFRLIGGPDSGFALGLKAAPTITAAFIAVGDGAAGSVGFGATPGLIVSFGSRTTMFTLTADFPLFFAGAGFVTGGGSSGGSSVNFTPLLRPAATIEFPVGETTNMYVQAQAYISLEGGGFLGPIIAVGAAW